MPDHLVRGRGAVGNEKAVISVEDARGVPLRRPDCAIVVQQLTQLLDRIADIGAQHVLTVELMIHLPDRAFEEGHAPGVPRTVPRVGAILGVIQQRLEKRRLDAFEVGLGVANDVAGDKFRRVLEHMDKAVQLTQDVIGKVAARLGFTVDVDRHIVVLPAHLLNEIAQVQDGGVEVRAGGEFLVINRQDKGAGAGLLLGELGQVAVAGRAKHLKAFAFDCLSHGADAGPGGIVRAIVFIDDDNREAKFHATLLKDGSEGFPASGAAWQSPVAAGVQSERAVRSFLYLNRWRQGSALIGSSGVECRAASISKVTRVQDTSQFRMATQLLIFLPKRTWEKFV